jgi:hypothetical protein
MREARSAGDGAAAVAHAARAHAAWPGQWVYAYGLASIGAMAGDTRAVARGLEDLAALGARPDLAPDTTLVRVARAAAPVALARIASDPAHLSRPEVAFRFPMADSTFWPEGLAHDGARGDFYVTGVREGRIARVDSSGRVHAFARVAPAGWAALGAAVDAAHDRIWVGAAAIPQAAGYAAGDSGRGAIVAFDRASGREVARFELPAAPEGHVPGDVLVTPGGDVYVSDSGQPVIWRVRQGRLETFATDPGFRSLQGQALGDDGFTLFVADYAHGIAAVDLASRAVTWLRPPPGATTLGIDGLAWVDAGPHGGRGLVAVQNGLPPPRVVSIDVEGRGAATRLVRLRERARDRVVADEPTLVVVAGPRLVYVANSQWEKHDERGVRRAGPGLEPPLGLVVPPLPSGRLRDLPVERVEDPPGRDPRGGVAR